MDDETHFMTFHLARVPRDASSPSFDSLCERTDDELFGKITDNTLHSAPAVLPSTPTTGAAV